MKVAKSRVTGFDFSKYPQIMASNDRGWLKAKLRGLSMQAIEVVVQIAAVVRRLDILGEEDIPLDPIPLGYMRRIAAGNLAPELYLAFNGNRTLLGHASRLPYDEQVQFARNEPVKLMVLEGPIGNHRLVRPSAFESSDTKQLFDKFGGVRDDAAQLAYLRSQVKSKPATELRSPDEVVELDRSGKYLIVHQPCKLTKKMVEMYWNAMNKTKPKRQRQAA